MSDDWYRNKVWNEAIAERFYAKLRRARNKQSYLRIQACNLTRSHPETALDLINQYFCLGEDFDLAQAYVDRANALLTLERVEEAIEAYEAALSREEQFPSLKTQAAIELPLLIAGRNMQSRFQQALDLLAGRSELMFPVDQFRWHAAHALIGSSLGDRTKASEHAIQALAASSLKHSGFRYHPAVGLVGARDQELMDRMEKLVLS